MLSQNLSKVSGDNYLSSRFKFLTISFSSKREQRMQLSFKVSCLVKRSCVCTIMAFIMSSFIHFILKFRDSCKDYYSQLVVHSQFKVTLSPVLVQAFLSESICLLTNNSTVSSHSCSFFVEHAYSFKFMKRNTNLILSMYSI